MTSGGLLRHLVKPLFGLKLRNVPFDERTRRAEELLELVGLAASSDRSVSQLSGGQQQRVALARALAINPRALLLDEPLAALDAGIRGHLRDQIRLLQRRFNATTLLVTHDQEEALTMADRVAVLKDGKLLQIASPRDIYERPASKAVAEFVGLSTMLAGTVTASGKVDVGFANLSADTGSRRPGSGVTVLIRPEHVVADPPTDAINRFAGRLGTQRYLGSVVRYDFHVQGFDKPVLAEARTAASQAISIPAEHVQLLDQ